MMDPETIVALVTVAITALGGAVAAVVKLHGGKTKQDQAGPVPAVVPRSALASMPRPPPVEVDPLEDTGRHIALRDSQRDLLPPMSTVEAINDVRVRLSRIQDGSNGHGMARRQELARVEKHVERIDGKVDRISEQVAAIRATCEERAQRGRTCK